jgi:hypothetical protein
MGLESVETSLGIFQRTRNISKILHQKLKILLRKMLLSCDGKHGSLYQKNIDLLKIEKISFSPALIKIRA